MKKFIFVVLLVFAVAGAAPFVLSIFVVQPIGAVPQGVTIVMLRTVNLNFIDSADAFCERTQGKVNLICRMLALGTIGSKAVIIARLPYSETLYLWSTDGRRYEK